MFNRSAVLTFRNAENVPFECKPSGLLWLQFHERTRR
jgi:hypothetical protein